MAAQKQLSLKVVQRDKTIFEGPIVSLSSYNDKGKFDILEMHANFISLVKDEILIRLENGEEKSIPIKDGVLKVENDRIAIYLGVKF